MEEQIQERLESIFSYRSPSEAFEVTWEIAEEFNITFLKAYKMVSHYLSVGWKT